MGVTQLVSYRDRICPSLKPVQIIRALYHLIAAESLPMELGLLASLLRTDCINPECSGQGT